MARKKKSIQEVAAVIEPAALEATPVNDLRARLEEIKTYNGVIGYILRNSTSAAIDLKDPTKIIDYAILSSSAFDASEELSELFNLGEIKNTVVEGKDTKMLSLTINENKISVFMEKNADSEKVLRKLHVL
ncbi:MAG: hypothetical protein QMD13_09120 [Candidatus Bathyarchaeia archaeon]|nr:hypothetical protein [Candidatus Bathyarchaeia archaeon]